MKLKTYPSLCVYEFCAPAFLRDVMPLCVDSPCGAQARCGKCRVRFTHGAPEPQAAELACLSAADLAAGWRLACVTRLTEDATVEMPDAVSATAYEKTFGVKVSRGECVRRAGLALDIGSTTLALALVDLDTAAVVGSESELNPQTVFGADVMSRVYLATTDPNGNARLHEVLTVAVEAMAVRLCACCGVRPQDVERMTVVGNPAMLHTFAGVDVRSLGQAPYEGVWTEARTVSAASVGLCGVLAPAVTLLSQIRCNVGADTVAAVLATEMDTAAGVSLLIDLGTNSEIVLACDGALCVTSTAAGPAFEGAGIRCGMRALSGAIDRVEVAPDGQWSVHTLGDAPAVGLCGSGLVDAVACLVRVGAVTETGRMLPADKSPCGAMMEMSAMDGRPQVRLGDTSVLVTPSDVEALQLVKGSIRAGTEVLLKHRGLVWGDVERLFIAGSFGQVINLQSAAAIELLPSEILPRVLVVGNAAGAGAVAALLAPETMLPRAEAVRTHTEYIDCTKLSGYVDIYSDAMMFAPLED